MNLTEYVNNHIHTTYSFSPYTPAAAAEKALESGLTTAGIMDHDCIAGAPEFIAAGERLGIATTIGFETRCKISGGPFAGVRTNNPDQNGVCYLACHGVPHQYIGQAQQWLEPVRRLRGERNAAMVGNINKLLAGSGVALDYERDVLPLSQAARGGSVTERHILYALAFRITAAAGKGEPVLEFLERALGIAVCGKALAALHDADSPDYEYALLGVLKSDLVERFFIPAGEECYEIAEFVDFTRSIGAVSAYPYLGDVTDSVTGDKKAQTFEDAFLDELVAWLAEIGFSAITYMPTRNTTAQLERVMALAERHGLFQISGEDINSPSQSFLCPALEQPEYRHLVTATWALIGHEKAATQNPAAGMFSPETRRDLPNLAKRVAHYASLGRTL